MRRILGIGPLAPIENGGARLTVRATRSRAFRASIPPPTHEQLMAGSASLPRVYRVEA
jgi:hypothetical protein